MPAPKTRAAAESHGRSAAAAAAGSIEQGLCSSRAGRCCSVRGSVSEPCDRDYAVPNAPALKSFIAMADALSRRGIVVLRVDDRGAGGSSGQKRLSSVPQLAGDLVEGVGFLKTRPEVDPKRIGIIGHSFAGLTAPMAALRSNDVAFVITLAGLLTDTRVNLARLPAGLREVRTATWNALLQSAPTLSPSELERRLRDAFTSAMANMSSQERAAIPASMAAIVTQWATPLRRSQALMDPGEALRALTKPFLAIHGAADRELDAATNLGPVVGFLSAARNVDFMLATIPDLDHWMWVCTPPSEPGSPCWRSAWYRAVTMTSESDTVARTSESRVLGGRLVVVLLAGASPGAALTVWSPRSAVPGAESAEAGFARDMATHHAQADDSAPRGRRGDGARGGGAVAL